MNKSISYFHAVNSGDIISTMAGIRHDCYKNNRKAIIYQKLNQIGHYMEGSVHPLKDGLGNMVTMNEAMLKMLKPLVEAQDYIEKLVPFDGEKCDVDLNRIHDGTFVNMPYGPIQMWTWFVFPFLRCDLSEPWLIVPYNDSINVSGVNNKYPRKIEDCIIINFTERYRNTAINYQFLRRYKKSMVFAGTEHEYKLFTGMWKLDIPYLQVNDFLELAQAINQCKLFIGNQSMCWNIAEALKVPRACEYFARAPNCFPFGKDGALYLYQGDVEDYVNQIMNADKSKLLCPVCDTDNHSEFVKEGVDYYKCSNCETLYSKYLEQNNMLGGLHGDETTVRSEQNAGRIERFKKMGVNILLDYGCGNGELVKDAMEAGMQVFGYDKYSEEYKHIPGGQVECVSLIEVIEHMYAPYNELDEINNLLLPGGLLYVETSFSDFLTMTDEYVDPLKGHHTIWSYKGMDMQMKAHGFEIAGIINRNTRVYKKITEI
jgi:2-polyprenyl-3-methyl-5-hydroxy-6-metoxy-1,4-benzoquinol methylase